MTCYTLFSGSSGNSIYLKKGNTAVLIDAGGSMKQIESALRSIDTSLCEIDAILVTHDHSDHTKGLPVMAKHLSKPIYCQVEVAKELYMGLIKKGQDKEAAALARAIRTVTPGEEYELGDLLITPFQTPHDSADSQGFLIGERELGIATDLGHISQEVSRYLLGCERVILESNHDLTMLQNGPYPPYLKERVASDHGHLSNPDCAAFCAELLQKGCRDFTLFHLSSENNTPELAQSTALQALSACSAKEGSDFALRCAARYEVTKV